MKDHRYVDELSVEELETILRLRRREERLRRLGNRPAAIDPLDEEGDDRATAEGSTVRRPGGIDAGLEGATGTRYSAVVRSPEKRQLARPIKWRWIRDQFLLLVEIAALLGFLGVVARMVLTVDALNEESRGLQTLPTATPTPVIGALILPSGHLPPAPDSPPEPAPIPTHLKDLVAAVTPLPVPTPGPEQAKRILIPAIDVDAPVVEGDDWETLKKGAGHRIGSANPGERGNCVISAHNDIYGEIFRDLPDLTVGDEITVQTVSTSYTYRVEQSRILDPSDPSSIRVLDATSTPVLTLVSCYPYRVDTHRIVVIASLVTD
ncbi:MAG: sortase [Anaerolineae bacterium]